jgi:hypothetical protein
MTYVSVANPVAIRRVANVALIEYVPVLVRIRVKRKCIPTGRRRRQLERYPRSATIFRPVMCLSNCRVAWMG